MLELESVDKLGGFVESCGKSLDLLLPSQGGIAPKFNFAVELAHHGLGDLEWLGST